MDVNMKREKPIVLLNKRELQRLAKAQEVLAKVTLVSCDQQELARTTAEAIRELAQSMNKGDLTKSDFLAGQTMLPFGERTEQAP